MAHFTSEYLQFFMELAANNHKDWFDVNRKRYEQVVKKPFQEFVKHLIVEMSNIDAAFQDLEPKDCIFRINRDIRFSKDKSPYKLQCSAVIAPEGKKSKAINGVYFELGPEHIRVYGGIYEIEKEDLLAVREGIAANLDEFKSLYQNSAFKDTFGDIRGEKNKIVPKELKAAAELEPLILNKQWYFFSEFPAETVLDSNLDSIILDCYKVGRPVEAFFNRFITH
jgi:uncharacterized protein (TIGR02453 family)